MFTPATKRFSFNSKADHDSAKHPSRSPPTPQSSGLFYGRPATGTPAPWAPRLSVLARIPPSSQLEKNDKHNSAQPVFVSDFPQVVRDEQSRFFRNSVPGDGILSGGMDRESCLSWIICGTKMFIWNYLPALASSKKCAVLDIPENALRDDIHSSWIACFVNWDSRKNQDLMSSVTSVGLLMCNRRTMELLYCPDVYGQVGFSSSLIVSDEGEFVSSDVNVIMSNRERQSAQHSGSDTIVSVITCPLDASGKVCFALASCSNGNLWQLCCDRVRIEAHKVCNEVGSQRFSCKTSVSRSLAWRVAVKSADESHREFLLLTDSDLQLFSVKFKPVILVSKIGSYEIAERDKDSDFKEPFSVEKKIVPLDMQIDSSGNMVSVLVATLVNKEASSSRYTKYSLSITHYESNNDLAQEEKKHSFVHRRMDRVIIPSSEIEDEKFLLSIRLRIGGKPSGSAIILSEDGTSTVSHGDTNPARLYQFNLPYDAGKVLDASVLPPVDDIERGTWVVLTEKAGIWAILEEAIRASLKLNFNEAQTKNNSLASDTEASCSNAIDEESEALLGQLFHKYLASGQASTSSEKLEKAGSFTQEGELNVFTRLSKSIVDTLAKHWTTTRGVEIMDLAIFSNQLYEKQQKHEQFLQFLALTKCHEELCSKQRQALLTILEHGEKLFSMIQLREMQNNSMKVSQPCGALWNLIQLVGEIARRKNGLLLDRDNAEVFYTKVSSFDDMFDCLNKHLESVISGALPREAQAQRSCEISNVIVSVLRSALQFKSEHHIWYPPPEGLTPWFCKSLVRNGFWRLATFLLQLLNDSSGLNDSSRSDLYSCLESLTEVFLETYSGAISAKLDRGEDIKNLRDEYWERRDSLLGSLYEHQAFDTAKQEGRLLSIARRHEGYATMWKICCDLNDFDLIRKLMGESMGPRGGFSYFVFKQLYEKKKFSKLLRLGEEFPVELSSFLKDHRDLLWLHQLYLHQFSSASESLHSLALAHGDVESFSDRERLLRLAKLSLVAGGGFRLETQRRIEADLKMMKLQEVLMNSLSSGETVVEGFSGARLLLPEELVRLCIDGATPELAVLAFDVFAWTSASFRRAHRSLLEACWMNAAEQDNWESLYEASVVEGWSEDETVQHLSNTVLFQAAARCYGRDADTFDGGFREVLPLTSSNAADPCVESIIMRHRDYSTAGKLMKAAVVLGPDVDNSNTLSV